MPKPQMRFPTWYNIVTMKVPQDPKKLEQLSDKLYKKYGKPLENEHTGEYLAVSFQGKTFLGNNLYEVVKRASDTFGRANAIVYNR